MTKEICDLKIGMKALEKKKFDESYQKQTPLTHADSGSDIKSQSSMIFEAFCFDSCDEDCDEECMEYVEETSEILDDC